MYVYIHADTLIIHIVFIQFLHSLCARLIYLGLLINVGLQKLNSIFEFNSIFQQKFCQRIYTVNLGTGHYLWQKVAQKRKWLGEQNYG